jgi:hypothetical protein
MPDRLLEAGFHARNLDNNKQQQATGKCLPIQRLADGWLSLDALKD